MKSKAIIRERLISLADIEKINSKLPKADADNSKRQLRTALFNAFDKHKGNIEYGAEIETPEQKAQILKWREDLKDLKTEAFKVIPDAIKYYYKGELYHEI